LITIPVEVVGMTNYCGNCGAELSDVNYCPECGANVGNRVDSKQESDTNKADTGNCEKCDSEISLEAERCPNCGYEPASHGWIISIISALFFGLAVFLAH
jgi:RNA polymerase subunit RPABC4/transcription elongation factor Spt4